MLPLICAMLMAVLLASFQMTYGPGEFEYQQFKPLAGRLLMEPYPVLVTSGKAIPLVAPGKHGASPLFAGMNRQMLSLSGARIHRDEEEMLEVLPDSIRPAAGDVEVPSSELLGSYTLEGEIVDSKCFLGVMNPGSGRVHRECAKRCISGGVPPLFVVLDRNARSRFLYLTNTNRELLDLVAETVRVSGQLSRRANLHYFRVEGITRR
jgi:hypothetical protein